MGIDAGDLMKSIYLLMYKAEEGVLEIRAKDFHSNYMTAVDILDDDTYLGAEINYNLFTVRKNSDAAADEDRNRLEVMLICSRQGCKADRRTKLTCCLCHHGQLCVACFCNSLQMTIQAEATRTGALAPCC